MKRGNSPKAEEAYTPKTGMEGWTSIGVKLESSELLKKMADELGITKRAITTIALDSFYKSKAYKEMVTEFKEINKLRLKYPDIFKRARNGD